MVFEGVAGADSKDDAEQYIQDPIFEGQEFFLARQRAYGKVGRIIGQLLEKVEEIKLSEEEKDTLERVFVAMSVIDFLIDNMHLDKSRVTQIITEHDSNIPSLNRALENLKKQIERCGDYSVFVASAARAISYSAKDTVQDRHREALYLGKAIAAAVRKKGEEQNRLIKILGILTSIGNFADDIMDFRNDGKSVSWAVQRMKSAVREVKRLYEESDKANTYLVSAAVTGLTLYGRRLIPKVLRDAR